MFPNLSYNLIFSPFCKCLELLIVLCECIFKDLQRLVQKVTLPCIEIISTSIDRMESRKSRITVISTGLPQPLLCGNLQRELLFKMSKQGCLDLESIEGILRKEAKKRQWWTWEVDKLRVSIIISELSYHEALSSATEGVGIWRQRGSFLL